MRLSENTTREFKRELTDEVKKCVVAFANTGGGVISIGIADDGTTVGIDDIDGEMLRLSNMVRDSIKPDVTLFVSYDIAQVDGKSIINVNVQKGTESPYYLSGKGIRPEGVYVRQGASSVPATETAILKMIKETDGERYEDLRSTDQDLSFEETAKEFESRQIPFGTNQSVTLKLVTPDGVFTNLGLLLSEQCVHTTKVAFFEGTSKVVFKDRREFSGSLLKQLNDVYGYIDRYNRTRSNFVGLHRIDTRDYPSEALREGLLNAVVHREYAYSASTLISVFDDRLEFVSVGGLVKGITYDDIMLGISVTRNENLANVFYRLNLIEAYGTGMLKIFHSYDDCHIKPKIEVSDNAFRLTLPNVNAPGYHSKAGCAGEPVSVCGDNEKAVLAIAKTNTSISRKDVEALLAVGQTASGRILKRLVEKGVLKAIGVGRKSRYVMAIPRD